MQLKELWPEMCILLKIKSATNKYPVNKLEEKQQK